MMLLPLLLLFVTIGSIWWYSRTHHEIYRVLAAALAIVFLVWSFAVAHWSLHLLGLLLLLRFEWLSEKLSISKSWLSR